MPVDFGTFIRDLRTAKGLSQKDLAGLVGISPSYQNKIEKGTVPPPSADIIRKYAAVLESPEIELFLLANKVPPEIARSLMSDSNLINFIINAADLTPPQWAAIREIADNRLISNPGSGINFTHGRRVRKSTLELSVFCYSLIIMGLGLSLMDLPGAGLMPLMLAFAFALLISRNYLLITTEYNLAVEKLPKSVRVPLRIINPCLLVLYEPVIRTYEFLSNRIFYPSLNLVLKLFGKGGNGA